MTTIENGLDGPPSQGIGELFISMLLKQWNKKSNCSSCRPYQCVPTPSLPAGYDEDAALQAALEASAREHAARMGQSSVPSSFGKGQQYSAPNEGDRQLQQALELSKGTSASHKQSLAHDSFSCDSDIVCMLIVCTWLVRRIAQKFVRSRSCVQRRSTAH